MQREILRGRYRHYLTTEERKAPANPAPHAINDRISLERMKTLESKGLLKMHKDGRTRLYSKFLQKSLSLELSPIKPSLLERAYNYWFKSHNLKSERIPRKIPLIDLKNKNQKLEFSHSDFSLTGVKQGECSDKQKKQGDGSVEHSDNLKREL